MVLDYLDEARQSEQRPVKRGAAPAVMTKQPDDRELMERAKSGDAKAFGQLIRQHQRRIYRVAVHMLRDSVEAEDVTQDTFVRAYAALARFDGRSQPYTWFYRIAVNLSLNRIRSRKRRRTVGTDDDPKIEALLLDTNPATAPERATADKQMGQALCAAVDGLSESLRTTLILVVIDGLSHAEASQVLGCPEGTVAWRIHEARKKIRVRLEELGMTSEETRS